MMKRVLIVDDELPILSGLSKALYELCDFQGDVRTVVNGREALNETGCCHYDVCFLDIKLPDINGFDVMRDIKTISPQTKIILMSGCYLRDDIAKIIDNERSFYIEKPFEFTDIKNVMKRILEDRGNYADTFIAETDGKRMHKRREMSKIVSFNVADSKHMEFKAGVIDISYSGVGLETYYPLERGHVISFKGGLGNKRGIVIWSYSRSEYNYRAGIRFI